MRCVLDRLSEEKLFLMNGKKFFHVPWTFGTDMISEIEKYVTLHCFYSSLY